MARPNRQPLIVYPLNQFMSDDELCFAYFDRGTTFCRLNAFPYDGMSRQELEDEWDILKQWCMPPPNWFILPVRMQR